MDEQHAGRRPIMVATTGSPPLAWRQPVAYASSPAYAGFWRRFLASLIDGVLVSFAIQPFNLLLNLVLERVVEPAETTDDLWRTLAVWLAASLTLTIVLHWLYYAVMEGSSWQATLGKRALGMAVTDLTGDRISFGRATGRYFARFVSGIILCLGYLIQPFTAKRQALHDIIAGTLVVRT